MNTALRLQEFVESHSEAPAAGSRVTRILQHPIIRSIWSLAILVVSLVLRVTNLPVLVLSGTTIKDVSATGKIPSWWIRTTTDKSTRSAAD
jgi:hypothetical protein